MAKQILFKSAAALSCAAALALLAGTPGDAVLQAQAAVAAPIAQEELQSNLGLEQQDTIDALKLRIQAETGLPADFAIAELETARAHIEAADLTLTLPGTSQLFAALLEERIDQATASVELWEAALDAEKARIEAERIEAERRAEEARKAEEARIAEEQKRAEEARAARSSSSGSSSGGSSSNSSSSGGSSSGGGSSNAGQGDSAADRVSRAMARLGISVGWYEGQSCGGGSMGCFHSGNTGAIEITSGAIWGSSCGLERVITHEYRHYQQFHSGMFRFENGVLTNSAELEQDAYAHTYCL